jgi:hypothetical protein
MLHDTFGNLLLGGGKIIELVYHGYINVYGTGLAMSAIGTLTFVGVKGSGCNYRGIVPFIR